MFRQFYPPFDTWSSLVSMLCVVAVFVQNVTGVKKQILDTKDVNICRSPFYYAMDTLYVIRAHDRVYSSHCEIKFLDWSDHIVGQPCLSLCVRVHNSSMTSCDFRMTYYDGLGDLNAQGFDCHSFPPILWCSRKNEIKISFAELRKYKGEGYDITLEVTSYCNYDEDSTKDNTQVQNENTDEESYEEQNRKEEKRQRDTVIIAGSLVSTVSIIFVIFWVTYCCWKRQYLTEPRTTRDHTTPGSATSSSTPKSEGSSIRPNQYTACTAAGTATQGIYPSSMRPYLQQKPTHHPYNNMNYPPHQSSERYIQLPNSGIEMQDSYAHYKNPPSLKEPPYRDDHFLGVECNDCGHSYDADDDSPEKELTPPIPPRPNVPNYPAKQYYI